MERYYGIIFHGHKLKLDFNQIRLNEYKMKNSKMNFYKENKTLFYRKMQFNYFIDINCIKIKEENYK